MPADPLISIVLSLLILAGAWRLIRGEYRRAAGRRAGHIALGDVEGRMRSVEGVAAVHDLHVWTVTSGIVAMSGHVVVPELAAHPGVLAGIQARTASIRHRTHHDTARNGRSLRRRRPGTGGYRGVRQSPRRARTPALIRAAFPSGGQPPRPPSCGARASPLPNPCPHSRPVYICRPRPPGMGQPI